MNSAVRTTKLLSVATAAVLSLLMFPSFLQAIDLERAEVQQFVADLVETHQFDPAYVQTALRASESKDSILEAISKPAERTMPWHEYRAIFMTPERIRAGATFWRQHQEVLNQIELNTGVPAEMVVGIIGVESYFGRRTGSYRVIDALATLGFDYPPRSKFFRRELAELFLLAREENFELEDLLGSYAGAMGPPQFIPSSYRRYAVDGNDDGQRDLFTNWDDILSSVANYFAAHDWQPDQPVTARGTLGSSATEAPVDNGLSPKETVASLSASGVLFATELEGTAAAQLMKLEGADGPEYWVGFHNFYVITRYNRSVLYALAAFQLGSAVGLAVDAGPTTTELGVGITNATP